MGKNGTHNDPSYTTRSGVVLRLQKMSPFLINFWEEDYRQRCPEPIPPMIRLENGDEWRNPKDEWYLHLMNRWIKVYNLRSTEFVLEYGILDDAPPDWTPALEFPDRSRKILWLLTGGVIQMDEIDDVIVAITTLTVPTEAAIEEAEKN